MDKEKFLKDLKYQLRYLNKETIDEELKNYGGSAAAPPQKM